MLRLALATALVVLLVAAGCGGSARPDPAAARGLPSRLAQQWAARASAIASAAARGENCSARRLAVSLRDDVIANGADVPARLHKPLLESVNSLAHRLTCPIPAQTGTAAPQPKPPPSPPKKHDDHRHHDHHGHGGDEGDHG